jgi:NAD(P)-dependent dehydrogenase (short-subunit alcohol dehydrogenase family)
MNPRYDFTGQGAVVTGGSSGMGLATAQAFAEAGAAAVLADVNEDALRAATDDLTGAGHQALGVLCDVSSKDQVAAMVDRAVVSGSLVEAIGWSGRGFCGLEGAALGDEGAEERVLAF